MEDINYKPATGIYIGGPVTMPDGILGSISDLWYKGDTYMAQVNLPENDQCFIEVNQLRAGWLDGFGTGT